MERLRRINRTLALLPDAALADTPLKPIEAMLISPSQRIDEIAGEPYGSLVISYPADPAIVARAGSIRRGGV